MSNRVIIFDTTLRDGEQSPGATMNLQEKLRMARQLESLGVDVIEAGFPASSVGDFEAVHAIANAVTDVQVAALARCNKNDIDRAWQALNGARNPRIHVFLATSPIHMEYKLRKTPDQVVEMAVAAVRHAAKYTNNVEFSAEDASRSNPDFLVRVFTEVINAGATTINVPDTVGYAQPDEYGKLIKYVIENTPNSHKAVFSVHCHDDLGLAVANSLSAIQNGARQAEVTLCGIGERAGNTSLEEVVMTLRCHKEIAVDTGIDARLITKASHLVSSLMNMPVQPNKAIVGRNAFAHSSGIHQDGVLKDRQTYEIIDPQDIGLNESVIALTARSGRAALVHRLELLGYDLTQEELDDTYGKFLELADKKKEIHDYDLLYLVGDIDRMKQQSVSLKFLQVTTGTLVPTATVVLKFGDHERMAIATGNGPVDAAVSAIKTLINEKVVLMEFLMQAITRGSNDVGRVHVQVQCGSRTVHGFAAHTDTTRASIEAFLDALRVLNVTERKEKEE